MKSFDTGSAIASIGEEAAGLLAVCFQNGVRNEILAAEKFKSVYGGMVYFSAKYLEPGVVIHVAENSLGLGLFPEGLDQTVDLLSGLLTRGGFSVTASEKIMAVKWGKLFRNLSNGFLTITGLSVLEAIKYEATRFMMADIIEEAHHVVQAEGIDIIALSEDDMPLNMIKALRTPGDHDFDIPEDDKLHLYPSTWQDLTLRRGRTEAEYFNGEIIQLGRKNNIATPFNTLMLRIVTQMAKDGTKPGRYTTDQLRTLLGEV